MSNLRNELGMYFVKTMLMLWNALVFLLLSLTSVARDHGEVWVVQSTNDFVCWDSFARNGRGEFKDCYSGKRARLSRKTPMARYDRHLQVYMKHWKRYVNKRGLSKGQLKFRKKLKEKILRIKKKRIRVDENRHDSVSVAKFRCESLDIKKGLPTQFEFIDSRTKKRRTFELKYFNKDMYKNKILSKLDRLMLQHSNPNGSRSKAKHLAYCAKTEIKLKYDGVSTAYCRYGFVLEDRYPYVVVPIINFEVNYAGYKAVLDSIEKGKKIREKARTSERLKDWFDQKDGHQLFRSLLNSNRQVMGKLMSSDCTVAKQLAKREEFSQNSMTRGPAIRAVP